MNRSRSLGRRADPAARLTSLAVFPVPPGRTLARVRLAVFRDARAPGLAVVVHARVFHPEVVLFVVFVFLLDGLPLVFHLFFLVFQQGTSGRDFVLFPRVREVDKFVVHPNLFHAT